MQAIGLHLSLCGSFCQISDIFPMKTVRMQILNLMIITTYGCNITMNAKGVNVMVTHLIMHDSPNYTVCPTSWLSVAEVYVDSWWYMHMCSCVNRVCILYTILIMHIYPCKCSVANIMKCEYNEPTALVDWTTGLTLLNRNRSISVLQTPLSQ